MADLASLGIVVKTTGVKEATRELGGLTKEGAAAEKQADKAAESWKRAGKTIGVGIAAGVGVAAVAFKKYFQNTIESEKVQAQLEARIKSTGMAAGLAVGDLNKMAAALQFKTSFDDESIGGVQSLLLTFTKIGRDTFPRATEAVLDMSTALGTDLNSAALQVGKALNDPVAGITALSRAGVQFSDSQKKIIKDMVETGKQADAQRLILAELEKQMGGAAVAARNTLGGALQALENSFNNLLEGNSGDKGIIGAREAIESLNDTLNDPKIKKGFADMVAGLAGIAEAAARAIGPLVELIRKQQEAFGFSTKSLGGGKRAPEARDQVQGLSSALGALRRGDVRGFAAGASRSLQGAYGFGAVADFSDVTSTSGAIARARNARGGSNRPETGAGGSRAEDPAKLDTGTRALRENTNAQRDNMEALRKRILAVDEFSQKQIALEDLQNDWRLQLENLTAELQGPSAVALLDYQRNLLKVQEAYKKGAITAPDLLKWEQALGEQYKSNTAAADNYSGALEGLSDLELARESAGFAFEDAFAGFIDGSRSAKEAFSDFADSFLRDASRMLAQQAALALFGGTGSGGEAMGSIFDLFKSGDWGFADGGFTGAGGKNQPAGIVHKGEYVLNAVATRHLPMDYLDHLNSGGKPAMVASGGRGDVTVQQVIQVTGVVNTRTAQQIAQQSGRETRIAMMRNR